MAVDVETQSRAPGQGQRWMAAYASYPDNPVNWYENMMTLPHHLYSPQQK